MPTDQPLLLLLILVVAIGIGWLLRGRGRGDVDHAEEGGAMREDYFRGLNHLLNEEPDKALEVFIRMVEVDSDTVETHFALGALFRRRGEVDRAIRIHQNLIARPSLSRAHRKYALYELGEDYMRAGLFDRAESLFNELVTAGAHIAPALRQLMTIYEQQRDWDQAIAAAERLESVGGGSQRRTISHYYCELADLAVEAAQPRRAEQAVRKARSADGANVRVELLAGALAEASGDMSDAVRAYKRALALDPMFAGEALTGLQRAFRKRGEPEAFDRYLDELQRDTPRASAAIALAAFCDKELTGQEVSTAMRRFLEQRGQGLTRLLGRLGASDDDSLESTREIMCVLLEDRPQYLCAECGFAGNTLYWQCPGCRAWGSVKPYTDFPHTPPASALPNGTARH